jgi:lysophospholipase L1-like esterase
MRENTLTRDTDTGLQHSNEPTRKKVRVLKSLLLSARMQNSRHVNQPAIRANAHIRVPCHVVAVLGLLAAMLGVPTEAQVVEETPGTARIGTHHWVGTWATAPHQPDLGVPGLANIGFENQTIRQIVHTSVGGRRVRVRLSAFGSNGFVVGAAHIALHALGAEAAILPESDRMLTFGGKPGITVPPGALVLSDPVNLNVPALADLAISIYTPNASGPATWHFESRQLSYLSTPGNYTASVDLPVQESIPAWFWLAGVDVVTDGGAVAAFGASIADGTQSTFDANHRWPDYLARQLEAAHGKHPSGVLNLGIAGSRMLHDSLGQNGLARFERDVLGNPGVTHVIVDLGGNDIFAVDHPSEVVTVDRVIQGHRQLIERAHAHGLKIYGCTSIPEEGFLIPGTSLPVFSISNEVKRQAVNHWIRTSRAYDAVIDFDKVLRDPDRPSRILPLFDSGDHGHPTDDGYQALADAVAIKLLQSSREDH